MAKKKAKLTRKEKPVVEPSWSQFLTQMQHGEHAVHLTARMVLCEAKPAMVQGSEVNRTLIGGVGISDQPICGGSEWELWECEVILVPMRKLGDSDQRMAQLDRMVTSLGSDSGWRKELFPEQKILYPKED